MTDLVALARIEELPRGASRCFNVEGRKVAVFHTESGLFATDDSCPHRGGPLSEGDLIRGAIVCPWHAWAFDLRTGRSDVDPEKQVAVHEVIVENETIYIRLTPGADTP